MKTLTINDITLHIANNLTEFKREIKKKKDYKAMYHPHHICGRQGILRYMIENIKWTPPSIHVREKSMSLKERVQLNRYIKLTVDKKLFGVLLDIKDNYRIDPTQKVYKEMMKGSLK